jgi:hypothetical protein
LWKADSPPASKGVSDNSRTRRTLLTATNLLTTTIRDSSTVSGKLGNLKELLQKAATGQLVAAFFKRPQPLLTAYLPHVRHTMLGRTSSNLAELRKGRKPFSQISLRMPDLFLKGSDAGLKPRPRLLSFDGLASIAGAEGTAQEPSQITLSYQITFSAS